MPEEEVNEDEFSLAPQDEDVDDVDEPTQETQEKTKKEPMEEPTTSQNEDHDEDVAPEGEKDNVSIVEGIESDCCDAPIRKTSNNRFWCTECKTFATVHEVKDEDEEEPDKPELKSLGRGRGGYRSRVENIEEEVSGDVEGPTDVLEDTLKLDPSIKGKHIEYIMEHTKVYGVLSLANINELIRDLNIKSSRKIANRVVKRYAQAIQNRLMRNPELQHEDEWADFIMKETGYRPPQQGSVSDNFQFNVPQQQQTQGMNPANMFNFQNPQQQPQQTPNSPFGLDGGMAGQVTPNYNNGGKKNNGSSLSREDVIDLFEQFKKKEEEEEVKDELNDLKKDFNDLVNLVKQQNQQLQMVAQGKASPRRVKSDDDSPKKIKEWVSAMKEIEDKVKGDQPQRQERSNDSMQMINELRQLRQDIQQTMEKPSGQLNQYDAEVQKTQAQVEAEKTAAQLDHEARREEAKERRKALESLASSLENSFQKLGEGMGAGIAGGGMTNQTTRTQQNQQQFQNTQQQTQDQQQNMNENWDNIPDDVPQIEVFKEYDDDGQETGRLRAECGVCGEEMVWDEGQTMVDCDDCGMTYQLNPDM